MPKWLFIFAFFIGKELAAQQTISGSFTFGGNTREYVIYEPANFDNSKPVPLLLVLHHNGSTGPAALNYMGFMPVADTANFISVYPTALPDPFASEHAWNSGLNMLNQIDDVGFLSVLIDTMASRYMIDLNRVYATGHSMGGYMSYRLGCELSGRIAAIAPSAGTLALPLTFTCNPSRPIPVMHKHGSNDNTVKWDGSAPPFSTSVDSTIAFWVRKNHCPATPVVTQLPDLVSDGITFTTYYYGPCDNESEVILYKGNNAPHGWQAFGHDIVTPVEVWNFLKRYSLDGLITPDTSYTDIINLSQPQPGFEVYPNPFADQVNFSSRSGKGLLKVFDTLGRIVTVINIEDQDGSMNINTSQWNRGIYILNFISNGQSEKRMIVRL